MFGGDARKPVHDSVAETVAICVRLYSNIRIFERIITEGLLLSKPADMEVFPADTTSASRQDSLP